VPEPVSGGYPLSSIKGKTKSNESGPKLESWQKTGKKPHRLVNRKVRKKWPAGVGGRRVRGA